MAERQWYSIKAAADRAEVFIYEQIGEDWWTGEGVTAKAFAADLAALKVGHIDLRVNSPGGSVFDGQAIYNAIKRHPARVTAYIDGLAASIASVIVLAADEVVMADNALFMIHNPWGCAQGGADAMRQYADLLDKVRETILSVYRERTGLDDATLTAAMDAETWFTADEAQTFGFIDRIGPGLKLAACFDINACNFRNLPAAAGHLISATAHSATTTAQKAEHKEDVTMSIEVTAPAGAISRNIAAEAAEIAVMCQQNGCGEKTADFIAAGLTPDQAARQILDLHASGRISTPAAEAAPIVDMGRQAKDYSYQRAILAAIDMREGRPAAGFEVDIHQEIARKLPQTYAAKGGILVPMRVNPLATTLTTGGSTTGAETVFTEYGEFIDLLRNLSVCTRMGARTLTNLTGPITFPKQTGAASVSWVAENPGSDVSGSNPTFGTLTMSPKTLMGTVPVSRQLLVQSTPDVEGIIRQDLAEGHALAWDLAGIHGSGNSNQPTGVYAASGVNAVAMGGVPTFGKLVDMETEINKDNSLLGTMGFVTTPGMAGKMRQTLESATAGASWIWQGPVLGGNMIGYRATSSNQVSATLGGGSEHGIVLGNWADLLIGMWAGMELVVDPYTNAKQGLVNITSFQMVDIGLRRATSFCKATGATIS